MKLKEMVHFEAAGVTLTALGLAVAAMVDLFQLSAFITQLLFIPVVHVLKFFLYRRVFKHDN